MTPRLPPDEALPQLPRVLDPDEVAAALERSSGVRPGAGTPQIRYVQYRPGASVIVRYEIELDGEPRDVVVRAARGVPLAERAAAPEARALARQVDGRSPVAAPVAYDDGLDALVQWPPLDLELPALATPPEELRRLLLAAGADLGPGGDLPAVIHYKPGRRAVLRVGDRFIKLYADEDAFRRSLAGLRAAERVPLRTPRLAGALEPLRLHVQTLVDGREPESAAVAVDAAGQLLAVLHAQQLEPPRHAPAEYRLRQAAGHARRLTRLLPPLAGRLEALVRRLEQATPDAPLVACHGDFFARQILAHDGDHGLVDFDSLCRSPAAFDLAAYVSSPVRSADDLPAALLLLDRLCSAYGGRPEGIPWFLATVLLRRATIPFRVLAADWPEQVETRLAAAEAVLPA